MSEIKNIIFDLNGVLFEYHSIFPNKILKPYEQGISLLNKCYEISIKRKNKLFVCTNFKQEDFIKLKSDFQSIFNLFDGYVNATMAQVKKPDIKMFKFLCDFYTILPNESLFIDDQIINILAAKEFGMKTIHFVNFEQSCNELSVIFN